VDGLSGQAAQQRRGAKDRSKYRQAAGAFAQAALTIGLKVRASVFHIEIYLWKLEIHRRTWPMVAMAPATTSTN
jgi:hypothetical protein